MVTCMAHLVIRENLFCAEIVYKKPWRGVIQHCFNPRELEPRLEHKGVQANPESVVTLPRKHRG